MSNVKEMTTGELLKEKKQVEEGFCGNHIPLDIRDEIGVMITEQQELKVRDAIDYLEAYLDKTNVAEEAEEVPIIVEPKELDEARIGEILAKAVGEAILKAQGKI